MYKTFSDAYDNTRNKISKTSNQAAAYVQAHWIDYVLIFLILFILNAFDVFILKRSDRFLSPEYWYHSVCRIAAYILAGILGVRVGYPKAKVACRELWDALSKNGHLVILKEQNGVLFSDFIDTINIEVKKSAWIAKINKKLTKLDKFSPNWFPLYYKIPKEEYLAKYRLLKWVTKWRVKKYCTKRQTLEALLVKDFIDNNIEILNVKFPRVFGKLRSILNLFSYAYYTVFTEAAQGEFENRKKNSESGADGGGERRFGFGVGVLSHSDAGVWGAAREGRRPPGRRSGDRLRGGQARFRNANRYPGEEPLFEYAFKRRRAKSFDVKA